MPEDLTARFSSQSHKKPSLGETVADDGSDSGTESDDAGHPHASTVRTSYFSTA